VDALPVLAAMHPSRPPPSLRRRAVSQIFTNYRSRQSDVVRFSCRYAAGTEQVAFEFKQSHPALFCIQYIYICKVDMRNGVQNGLDSCAFHPRKQRRVRLGQGIAHSALGQVKAHSLVPGPHQIAISQPMSATRARESQPTTLWLPLPLTPLAGPGSSLQVAT
jgi:hypothetical protein